MARDPFDASRIAYVDNGITPHPVMQSAIPWDGKAVKPVVWYPTRPPGSYPATLNTLEGAVKRAVWAQTTTSSSTADVIYEIDDDGTGPQSCTGRSAAPSTRCASSRSRPRTRRPIPIVPHRVIATCDA